MAMTEEERREYARNYYKSHKEERKEWNKNYQKKHKEKRNEYVRNYNKKHKEKRKEWQKNYQKKHKEELREYSKKYNNDRRFYDSYSITNIISHYHLENFSRFISILGYFTVLKSPDSHLRKSIMTNLGRRRIDEKEAIKLSGQVLTQEDIDLINSYVSQYKSRVS